MKKSTWWVIAGVIVILAIVILKNADNKTVTTSDTPQIKIGIILPLSGNTAKAGEDSLAAIRIAQEDLREKYPDIKLVVEDSEFSSSKTISAFNKLVNVDGVVGVIGGLNSSAVEAVKPVAQKLKVVMLSPGGAASSMGEYVYKNSHEASKEGGEVAQFSFDAGNRTAAILYMDNDFGELEKDSFVDRFKKLGGQIVAIESFNISSGADYRTQLTKINSKNPDALLIVSLGGLVGTASRQVQELGINPDLYGIYGTESSDLLSVGGESLEGLVYSFPISTINQTRDQKKFIEAFREKVGGEPQLLSYNAYDLYSMLAELATECGGDPVCINEEISSKTEFKGIGGTVTIEKTNGQKSLNRQFYFRTIKDGKIVEVDR